MTDQIVSRLARGRVYYGWFIVGVVLSGGIPRVGLNGSFFGIFLKPMSEECGWSRAEMTWAVTIGTFIAAALGVFLGRVLDRFGPRWMMAGGFTLLAVSYFGLATVSSLIGFYLIYAIGRSTLQSATGHQLLYALVSKWCIRRRAMAISTATIGGYIGGIVLAPVTQTIINHFSWREAWVFFGVLTAFMGVIPAIIFLRRLPEDLSLLPDGDGRFRPTSGQAPTLIEASFQRQQDEQRADTTIGEDALNLKEALRTVSFWLLTVMVTVNTVGITAITFHMVPHFSDVGISSTAAAASVSFLTAGSIASVFLWGYLSDRVGAKRMLLIAVATLGIASLLVARTDTAMGAYVSSAVFGIGLAGTGLLSEVVWADFFGRQYLGSIRGATIPFQMIGNASGSLIAAFLYDLRGNYDDAFRFILVLYAVSMILLAIARRPTAKR